MIVIAIDPGVVTGIAVVSGRTLVYHDQLRHDGGYQQARESLGYVLASTSDLSPARELIHLIIEDQYDPQIARRRGVASGWSSIAPLVERRVQWECAGHSLGITVADAVAPGVWKPALARGVDGGLTRAIELRYPGVRLRTHERDAAGIAAWYAESHPG